MKVKFIKDWHSKQLGIVKKGEVKNLHPGNCQTVLNNGFAEPYTGKKSDTELKSIPKKKQ